MRELSEKKRLAFGSTLSVVIALLCLPLITRGFSQTELAKVSLVLMAHAFLGVLDILRPVIVKEISLNTKFATLPNLLYPSTVLGVLYAFGVFVGVSTFMNTYFTTTDAAILAVTTFVFLLYSPFWAILDAAQKVGTAYCIRTLSTVLIYVTLAVLATSQIQITPTWILLLGNSISAVLFMGFARSRIAAGHFDVPRRFVHAAISTFAQNIYKTVADFADRIITAIFLGPVLVASYNLSYEVTSKANIFSQMISAYYYPVICEKRTFADRVYLIGMAISFMILTAAIGFYFWGEPFFTAYFGANFTNNHALFSALLSLSSIYAQSFFGQIILRAQYQFFQLSLCFAFAAVLGLAAFIFLRPDIGLPEVLIIAFCFKSSSVWMNFYLIPILGKKALLGLFLTGLNVLFSIGVFYETSA